MQCNQCEKPARAAGLCMTHYSQQYRARRVQNTPAPEPVYPAECSECGQPVKARGMCMRHYQQFRRSFMGKGRRVSAGACTDGKPHAWGDGACRLCGVQRPIGWT